MTTNTIKDHFEKEADQFDSIIIKLIPYYEKMLSALIDSIHFSLDEEIRIIDLGCGTGTIAKRLSEKFPNAKIVCLDIASNMIDIAKHKLSDHKNSEFIVGDFSKIDFEEQFDIVVSSLALHHIESDEEKKAFFQKIYTILGKNGQFINADLVLASNDFLQNVYLDRWIGFMNKSVSLEEINNRWLVNYKNEDRPSRLVDQIHWLEEIGFNAVDVVWKYYNFSVYTGSK